MEVQVYMKVQVYKGTGISRYRYMKVQVFQGKGGEDVVKSAVKVGEVFVRRVWNGGSREGVVDGGGVEVGKGRGDDRGRWDKASLRGDGR